MSLRVHVDVHCDFCGKMVEAVNGSQAMSPTSDMIRARDVARAHGWGTVDGACNGLQDACPSCMVRNQRKDITT